LRNVARLALPFALPVFALAQVDRILGPIDLQRTVSLNNGINARLVRSKDLGLVRTETRLSYLTLVLKRSDQQRNALRQLLEEQQNPAPWQELVIRFTAETTAARPTRP